MAFSSLSRLLAPSSHRQDGLVHGHIPRGDAWVLGSLVVTIPAFYLHLAAPTSAWWRIGSVLYALAAAGLAAAWVRAHRRGSERHRALDAVILIGVLASLAGGAAPWSGLEWALRLALVALIVTRLLLCLVPLLTRHDAGYLLLLGLATLLLSGLGFYWLEPTVRTYADGLWLAFESGATVGYGDIVPTTPAARVFAVFMVLIGYALLSLVTASIAAFFVGEDEKQLRRELHRDIKALHDEVRQLRQALEREPPHPRRHHDTSH